MRNLGLAGKAVLIVHKSVRGAECPAPSAAGTEVLSQVLEERLLQELGRFPEWKRVRIEAAGGGGRKASRQFVTSTCIMFMLFPP